LTGFVVKAKSFGIAIPATSVATPTAHVTTEEEQTAEAEQQAEVCTRSRIHTHAAKDARK
jgi:CCR4-NOT transcriptional regulation complex NOT5 subunit